MPSLNKKIELVKEFDQKIEISSPIKTTNITEIYKQQ